MNKEKEENKKPNYVDLIPISNYFHLIAPNNKIEYCTCGVYYYSLSTYPYTHSGSIRIPTTCINCGKYYKK